MGGGGSFPRSGFEGAEPLASPNVLRWVGWLPFITRCGPAPLSPPRTAPRRAARERSLRRKSVQWSMGIENGSVLGIESVRV